MFQQNFPLQVSHSVTVSIGVAAYSVNTKEFCAKSIGTKRIILDTFRRYFEDLLAPVANQITVTFFRLGVDIEIKDCGMLTFWADSTGCGDRIMISLSHAVCIQHGKRFCSMCVFGP